MSDQDIRGTGDDGKETPVEQRRGSWGGWWGGERINKETLPSTFKKEKDALETGENRIRIMGNQ